MCGRFTLTVDPAELQTLFGLSEPPPAELGPRYNIAPTQLVAAVANEAPRKLAFFQWGLIPSWAKDPKIGHTLINARGETVAEKPAFRAALKKRRCLIVADGFYEWRKLDDKTKQPYFIQLKDGRPFAFAGLWEAWKPAAEGEAAWRRTCTIITTTPNALMQPLHDRMPVILPPEAYAAWLTPGELPTAEAVALIQPYPAEAMTARPVSTRVNNPRHDAPDLVAAA